MWKEVVEKHLIGEHRGSGGAVCGYDGGVWGRTDTFHITIEEAVRARRAITRACRAPKTGLGAIEFTMSGVEFVVTTFDEEYLELSAQAKHYKSGASLKLLDTALVIGYYDAPTTAEENLAATRKVAQMLLDLHVST